MVQFTSIPLTNYIPGLPGFRFESIELIQEPAGPIGIVFYSESGVTPEFGLRLDLDKQVFLDHLDDPAKEEVAKRAAPQIVEYLRRAYFNRKAQTAVGD